MNTAHSVGKSYLSENSSASWLDATAVIAAVSSLTAASPGALPPWRAVYLRRTITSEIVE